jgi:hypothetical protein
MPGGPASIERRIQLVAATIVLKRGEVLHWRTALTSTGRRAGWTHLATTFMKGCMSLRPLVA